VPDSTDDIASINKDAQSLAQKFSEEHGRELLTILFTDLVDSTKLQSDLGNAESTRLGDVHRKIVRDELAQYDAREIDWAGDSCLAVFTKPSDGIQFALRMQAAHRRARESEPRLPLVRVGLHLGEIIVKEDNSKLDLFGLQVSEAARVMSVAEGNQIYCTRAVFDNARSALTGQELDGVGKVFWVRHGMYMLKGSADPVELCEVGSSDVRGSGAPKTSDKVVAVSAPVGNSKKFLAIAVVALLILGASLAYQFLKDTSEEEVAEIAEEHGLVPEAPKHIRRYQLGLKLWVLPSDRGVRRVAISRDGLQLAYVTASEDGVRRLAVRRFEDLESRILPGTEWAVAPFFSPDGKYVGFKDDDNRILKRISLVDETVADVVSVGFAGEGAWDEDGFIVFGSTYHHGLHRVKVTGGEPVVITKTSDTPGESLHTTPQVLPNDAGYLFSSFVALTPEAKKWLYVVSDDDTLHPLGVEGVDAQYVSTGHIVFLREGSGLMARTFDLDTYTVGEEEYLFPEKKFGQSKQMSFDISANGTLVYAAADHVRDRSQRSLVWVDMDGGETDVEGAQANSYDHVRISPDGKQVVLTDENDILVYDFETHRMAPLSFTDEREFAPIWSRDGTEITWSALFDRSVASMFTTAADGTGTPEQLQATFQNQFPQSWSLDGKKLVFAQLNDDTGFDMGLGHFGDDQDSYSEMVMQSPEAEGASQISPDGKWIAYAVREDDGSNVYVTSFPEFKGKWRVSEGGGFGPVWATDGSALYFRQGEKMMEAVVQMDTTAFNHKKPTKLWERPYLVNPLGGTVYDVHPDGKFLMIKELNADEVAAANDDIVIVENWFEELKRIAPHPEVK